MFDHALLNELEMAETCVLATDLERRGLVVKSQVIRILSVTEWVALAARTQHCISLVLSKLGSSCDLRSFCVTRLVGERP